MLYEEPAVIIFLTALLFFFSVSAYVYFTSTYKELKKKRNKVNLSGCEIARKILDSNDLENVYVVETSDTLFNHYDPARKVIRFSKNVFHESTIASLAISAYICGYAIQDKEGNGFMGIRFTMLPFVRILTYLGYIGVFISLLTRVVSYWNLSIALLLLVLLFHLVTLPIELDASKKALNCLKEMDLIGEEEEEETERMIKASTMTYVASIISYIVELFHKFGDLWNKER